MKINLKIYRLDAGTWNVIRVWPICRFGFKGLEVYLQFVENRECLSLLLTVHVVCLRQNRDADTRREQARRTTVPDDGLTSSRGSLQGLLLYITCPRSSCERISATRATKERVVRRYLTRLKPNSNIYFIKLINGLSL